MSFISHSELISIMWSAGDPALLHPILGLRSSEERPVLLVSLAEGKREYGKSFIIF